MKSKFRINRPLNLLAVFLIVALLSVTVPARTVQAATRFVLAKTILSPTPSGGGFFGQALAVAWGARGRNVTLQVNKSGTGAGTVTSSPAGISCGSTCSARFNSGTTITLSATPTSGSVFAGWNGGGCSGTGPCTITPTANTTVTATFNTSGGGGGTFTLTVNKIKVGLGDGTVTSTPAGISCDPTCTASFPAGTSITLFASPSAGKFVGWGGGACSGSSQSCTFTLNANTTVSAQFNLVMITDNSLPNGNVGADYSAFISSCCGSGSPDNFSIVSGSLPNGLTMAQNFGVQSTLISGRPTQVETRTFTVKVQDQSGSSTKVLSITIDGPVPLEITLPGPTARSGTVGTAYSQNLFASGGKTPYSWSSTGGQLPPGLRFVSASNGNRIEGTPTTAGTFTFTLTVTDSGSPRQTATQQTTITISSAASVAVAQSSLLSLAAPANAAQAATQFRLVKTILSPTPLRPASSVKQ